MIAIYSFFPLYLVYRHMSAELGLIPALIFRNLSNNLYHILEACFNPYIDFRSFMDFPFVIRCSNPGGARMITASSCEEFKKAVHKSILFAFKFNLTARDSNTVRVERLNTSKCLRS